MALEHALTALLDAAKRFGIGPDRLVIAITAASADVDGDTSYVTHVGRTEDLDRATMLGHMAKDLVREADDQSRALIGRERCPNCNSPRLTTRRRRIDTPPGQPPGIYVAFRDECMDCDYKGPDR